jgi:pantetheine-phosphate adenylyltransferase
MNNQDKHYLFSVEQRIEMLKKTTKDLKNVSIYADSGLTVDFAHKRKADIIIRGLRATMDFEYELQQSTINMTLAKDVETIFFMAKPQYSFPIQFECESRGDARRRSQTVRAGSGRQTIKIDLSERRKIK